MQFDTFTSTRIFILMLHFLLTTSMYWTRYPSVAISLSPNYSSEAYQIAEDSYISLISFGMMAILAQFAMLTVSYGKLYCRNVITMGLDVAAIFFISWIVLDGLDWHTYIYIFIFCVMLPAIWESFFVIPHIYYYIAKAFKILANICYEIVFMAGQFMEDLIFNDD